MLQAGFFVVNVTYGVGHLSLLEKGGIDWRGTHYSIEELRAGQRVKFSVLPVPGSLANY